jgi:hypothetical protein
VSRSRSIISLRGLLLCALQTIAAAAVQAQGPSPSVFPFSPAATVSPQGPQRIDTIAADEVLVLESPEQLALVVVPDGAVTIEKTEQPSGAAVVIRGKFAGGGGKPERRRYTAPWVYEITANSTGPVEIIAFPLPLVSPTAIQRQRYTLGGATPAPVVPVVPVVPVTPPGPVSTELRVLLLLDQDDDVQAQAAASAVPVLQWLDANCVQDGGRASWRRWDRTAVADSLEGAPPIFAKLYREVQPKLLDGPQAVIARGSSVSIVGITGREQLLAALKGATQ